MPRKSIEVTIPFENRDKGKVYVITELPARQAELWGAKFLFALGKAGVQIPPDVMQSGFAGAAVYGAQSFASMQFADARELMDEMFTCVRFKPDPTGHPETVRGLVTEDEDIEEVQTRLYLRERIITLHMGFSIADALSRFLKSIREKAAADSLNAQTSQGQSLPSS